MVRCSITGSHIDQVRSVGVTNIKVLKHTGVMFADLNSEQIRKLELLGCTVEQVQNIKSDVTVPKPEAGTQTYTPQYLSRSAGFESARSITKPPLDGFGINVAVVDTGIRETHQQINGRVAYRKNYTPDTMEDGFDHGTGVASILLAVAPACNILNLKVMNSNGDGTTEEVIEAIEDCIELWDTDPAIAPVLINLSVGAVDHGNINDPLRVACRAALENRIWLSAAAGNSGPEPMTIVTPAVEKYVFATGSLHPDTLRVSKFSSRGPTLEGLTKPDAVFFGENIQMASSKDDTATVGKSGTSFSAPFSSGIAVLYLQGSAAWKGLVLLPRRAVEFSGELSLVLSPEWEIQASLQQLMDGYLGGMCVKPQGAPQGKDDEYGYGMPVGALMAQAIAGKGITPITDFVSAAMVLGMGGVMAKQFIKGGKSGRI